MKKNTINLIAGAILIIGIIAIAIYATSPHRGKSTAEECPPPARPDNVPADARWIGGCAGGNWIYMVSDSSNYYRFQVFSDWRGQLLIDTRFVPENETKIDLDSKNWKERGLYYQEGMDSTVYIVMQTPTDTVKLRSIYPAYGGEVWKKIQEDER